MTLPLILSAIAEDMAARTDCGQVAGFIPRRAAVDLNQFGISVCLADGTRHSAGDSATPFSIQSISRVFALAVAAGRTSITVRSPGLTAKGLTAQGNSRLGTEALEPLTRRTGWSIVG